MLITAQLYQLIGTTNMITLNESHVNLIIKHLHQRVNADRLRYHRAITVQHECNYECYGFDASSSIADKCIQLFDKMPAASISLTNYKGYISAPHCANQCVSKSQATTA